MVNQTALALAGLYDLLRDRWGPQDWWPAESTIEMIVGAILTQNTAWHNVEKAIAGLRERDLLDGRRLLAAPESTVKEAIHPSGFYNVKYDRLCSVLRHLAQWDFDWSRWRTAPLEIARPELLDVRGLGPETVDCILLYGFGRPVFVVDAYTRRLLHRLGHGWADAPYNTVAAAFCRELAPVPDLYGEYHALIVTHCKHLCKKTPLCAQCVLRPHCPAAGAQT